MTARPAFELADVFRRHGETYAQLNAGHLGRVERRVSAAIAACRTAALGGHVERCDDCGLTRIAYNSCRNRHCPKCQGAARVKRARRPPSRAAAGSLFPCRVHLAVGGGRDRLPEQADRLWPLDARRGAGDGAWLRLPGGGRRRVQPAGSRASGVAIVGLNDFAQPVRGPLVRHMASDRQRASPIAPH